MNQVIRILLALTLLQLSAHPVWAQDSSDTPSSSLTVRQQADAEMEQARELLKQGYFDSAVVKYQDAFKIAPDYTAPYEELGKLMMDKKNFAYAIQMYEKLINLEPRNPQYRKVMFSLYDAYEASDDALASGEVLVELGEADDATIKRMADLYEQVERPLEKARMMELYAQNTDADAEYWHEVSRAYSAAGSLDEAESAALTALKKAPDEDKYRTSLARIYADQGKLSQAEAILSELAEKSPNDQGIKDELAQLYARQGDLYLQNGRANTALDYYKKSEAAGKADEVGTEPGTGNYTGTVSTAAQIYNSSISTPGIGPTNYRQGATRFTTLGETLAERKASAELLLRPQYLFDADFGNSDVNKYQFIDNIVRVPIRGTELDLRVRQSYREASSSIAGSASREYIYAGANYNWNLDWSTEAYVGTNGLYDTTTLYEGDVVRGGFILQRDIWPFTPTALGTDLYFNRQGLFGGVSIGERFAIDGAVDFYQFNDNVDQTIYSIGPSYQLLIEPGVQELALGYVYSSQSNTRLVDPLLRFSPLDLTANSLGLDYARILSDGWRVRAGYFYTWVNDGTSTGTWNVGTDVQLWEGAWIGLNYERGNFAQGVINQNIQSFTTKNDNLNVNFGVSF